MLEQCCDLALPACKRAYLVVHSRTYEILQVVAKHDLFSMQGVQIIFLFHACLFYMNFRVLQE